MNDEIDALFRSEYVRLVRALGVACGDADRAAEAVQDAFVQATRHWPKVRHYENPALWLRRVAVNRLADQRRSSRRARRGTEQLGGLSAERDVPGRSGSVPGPEALSPTAIDVRDALALLPLKQRLAITLHHLADLPVSEVADLLGVAPGTIKSQLSDARANLFRLLEVPDER